MHIENNQEKKAAGEQRMRNAEKYGQMREEMRMNAEERQPRSSRLAGVGANPQHAAALEDTLINLVNIQKKSRSSCPCLRSHPSFH